MTIFKFIVITISFMLNNSFADSPSSNTNTLIPRQVLFGNPDKTNVRLSHDGKYIIYIAPVKGVLNIHIAASSDPLKAAPITQDTDRGIRNYSIIYDNKHIFYTKDQDGDENTRIYSYNIETKNTKLLTPEKGVKSMVITSRPKIPNKVLIATNQRDKKFFDVYEFDLETGSKELVIENNKFTNWVIDHDLKIRFASLIKSNGDVEYFEYKENKFTSYMTVPFEDTTNTAILGFDKTGNILYLADSRNRNTAALVELNLITKSQKIISANDRADITIFTVKPGEYNIQGTTVNYDKPIYDIIDDEIKPDIEYLAKNEIGELGINSRTLDDTKWLVTYSSDIKPVQYYFYDRKTKKADFLFSNRQNLEEYSLAPMEPIIIKSRDGLDLVSYLTKPLDAINPVPLVLYVHGGPWARDYWGLDPVHQWLANRGYAVLSVNFRISTGFGKDFANAGNGEWGKKMHDDLIDAVN